MRILHVEKKMKLSGQALRVARALGGLRARGHEVALACQPGSALGDQAEREGIPTCRVPMVGARAYASVARLRRFVRRGGFQVVHAHGARDHLMCGLARLGLRGVALVRTKHNMRHLRPGRFGRLLYTRLTTRLVAVSGAVRDVLLADGVPADHIEVIFSGIETDRFAPRRPDPRVLEDLGVSPGDVVIGLVARLSSKSVDTRTLMRAFGQLVPRYPGARLLLVGRWSGRVARWADELGITDRLLLPGFTDDVPAMVSAMDVYVQPDVSAGMGSALLEAMAMGKPVVASRVGGIPEAVLDGQTGRLCPPGDPGAMAEAIASILDLPSEQRAALGQRGRQRAEELFDRERMVEQLEALYERVARPSW
ncbi:MAG: glycosyltransferase [Candidatus Brocadiia bacterium]